MTRAAGRQVAAAVAEGETEMEEGLDQAQMRSARKRGGESEADGAAPSCAETGLPDAR